MYRVMIGLVSTWIAISLIVLPAVGTRADDLPVISSWIGSTWSK